MQGIEVYADSGAFQFGDAFRGMKVVKKIVLPNAKIISGDTGNSTQPNFYLDNHWWSNDPQLSDACLVAVRPLQKEARFYMHFTRGRTAWFNTPSSPAAARLSVFVSRPCEIYVYDFPPPPPAHMAGRVVWDAQGRVTFSTDGIHMRIAAFAAGDLPVSGPSTSRIHGPVRTHIGAGEYMLCPITKPYQVFLDDVYSVGSSTFYDFIEYNPWYTLHNDGVTIEPSIGFIQGVSGLIYSDFDAPNYAHLILHADWEQNYPIQP